jgi:hypothetical protein
MDKLDKFIRDWEEFCESENCHSEYALARDLSQAMLKNGVDRSTTAKILDEGLYRPL